jgi:hypothetical protein
MSVGSVIYKEGFREWQATHIMDPFAADCCVVKPDAYPTEAGVTLSGRPNVVGLIPAVAMPATARATAPIPMIITFQNEFIS